MEKAYWLSRKRASLKLARNAAGSEARLVHYELAGRYSVKASSVETRAASLDGALSRSISPVRSELDGEGADDA